MYIQLSRFNPGMPDREQIKKIKLVKNPGVNTNGIDEILDVVDLGISFINSVTNAYSDGYLGINDLQHLLEPLKKTPKALSGLDKVPSEVENMTDAEIETIISMVEEGLHINSCKALEVLRCSIDWVYSTYNLFNAIKE